MYSATRVEVARLTLLLGKGDPFSKGPSGPFQGTTIHGAMSKTEIGHFSSSVSHFSCGI